MQSVRTRASGELFGAHRRVVGRWQYRLLAFETVVAASRAR